LLKRAKKTLELGPGLLSPGGDIQHHWVVLIPLLLQRFQRVVIIDKGKKSPSFKGTLHHVRWDAKNVLVEGIRDADDKSGQGIYTDWISFLSIASGDVYFSVQDAMKQ
jgi:hypothetical protein